MMQSRRTKYNQPHLHLRENLGILISFYVSCTLSLTVHSATVVYILNSMKIQFLLVGSCDI